MLAALAIFGAACIFLGCHPEPETGFLEIRNTNSGRLHGRLPIEEYGRFAIEFIHSVNQSPVTEFFRVENGMIRLLAVRFFSYGAGIQSDLQEGQTLNRDGDAMILSGLNTSFKELNYIIGTVSDHLLIIDEQVISLRELFGRNAQITIYIDVYP